MLFIDNKYHTWYNSIITRAQSRAKPDTYTEKHHIIPRSMGGSDDASNIAVLTAREHFICHWLLTKITQGTDRYRMAKALDRMCTGNRSQQRKTIPSRIFQRFREAAGVAHSKLIKGTQVGSDNPFYGKRHSQETKDKISKANTGRSVVISDETKAKLSISMTGKPKTEAHKQAIKDSWDKASRTGENHPLFGKEHTAVTKAKMRESSQKRWADPSQKLAVATARANDPITVCAHCGKSIKGKWNYTQHTRKCFPR